MVESRDEPKFVGFRAYAFNHYAVNVLKWEDVYDILLNFKNQVGNSLAVQWLGFCASTAGGTGSIPGWGTKILQAERHGQKKKKKPNLG